MGNKEPIIASWNISLDVECPNCKHYFDIINDYHDQEIYRDLEVGEYGKLKFGFEITCPDCDKEFEVEELCN